MAYTIDTAIEALESTRRLMGLEEENQDLGSKLKQADAQIQRLKDIIDKQAEATRRNDNPHIRGD
jgi:prefoldin subunit 5